MPKRRALAAKERGAAAIASRTAAELYGLDDPRAQHRGRGEEHHALPRARRARRGAVGQGQDFAHPVDAQRARRRPRAADAARQERRQHDAGSNRGPRAPGLWEYVFFVDIEGHARGRERRARARRSSSARRRSSRTSAPIPRGGELDERHAISRPQHIRVDRAVPARQADLRARARDGPRRGEHHQARVEREPARREPARAARDPRRARRISRAIPTATASS